MAAFRRDSMLTATLQLFAGTPLAWFGMGAATQAEDVQSRLLPGLAVAAGLVLVVDGLGSIIAARRRGRD